MRSKKAAVISVNTVRHVASLAKISLSDSEVRQFQKDLNEILDAFKKLDAAKTDNEASFHPMEIRDVLREDLEEKCLTQEKALENAAHKEKGFFKGPRVV